MIDKQKLLSSIKHLPLSKKQRGLCLNELETNKYSQDSIISVLAYLESIAQLKHSKSQSLKQDAQFYSDIISLYKQSQKGK